MTGGNQIKLDMGLVQKHGLEEAVVVGMLSEGAYMLAQGKQSVFSQTINAEYSWDVRKIDGRIWYGFADTDLKVLAPFWEPSHTRQLLNNLTDKGVFDTQEGSKGTHYSFRLG